MAYSIFSLMFAAVFSVGFARKCESHEVMNHDVIVKFDFLSWEMLSQLLVLQ